MERVFKKLFSRGTAKTKTKAKSNGAAVQTTVTPPRQSPAQHTSAVPPLESQPSPVPIKSSHKKFKQKSFPHLRTKTAPSQDVNPSPQTDLIRRPNTAPNKSDPRRSSSFRPRLHHRSRTSQDEKPVPHTALESPPNIPELPRDLADMGSARYYDLLQAAAPIKSNRGTDSERAFTDPFNRDLAIRASTSPAQQNSVNEDWKPTLDHKNYDPPPASRRSVDAQRSSFDVMRAYRNVWKSPTRPGAGPDDEARPDSPTTGKEGTAHEADSREIARKSSQESTQPNLPTSMLPPKTNDSPSSRTGTSNVARQASLASRGPSESTASLADASSVATEKELSRASSRSKTVRPPPSLRSVRSSRFKEMLTPFPVHPGDSSARSSFEHKTLPPLPPSPANSTPSIRPLNTDHQPPRIPQSPTLGHQPFGTNSDTSIPRSVEDAPAVSGSNILSQLSESISPPRQQSPPTNTATETGSAEREKARVDLAGSDDEAGTVDAVADQENSVQMLHASVAPANEYTYKAGNDSTIDDVLQGQSRPAVSPMKDDALAVQSPEGSLHTRDADSTASSTAVPVSLQTRDDQRTRPAIPVKASPVIDDQDNLDLPASLHASPQIRDEATTDAPTSDADPQTQEEEQADPTTPLNAASQGQGEGTNGSTTPVNVAPPFRDEDKISSVTPVSAASQSQDQHLKIDPQTLLNIPKNRDDSRIDPMTPAKASSLERLAKTTSGSSPSSDLPEAETRDHTVTSRLPPVAAPAPLTILRRHERETRSSLPPTERPRQAQRTDQPRSRSLRFEDVTPESKSAGAKAPSRVVSQNISKSRMALPESSALSSTGHERKVVSLPPVVTRDFASASPNSSATRRLTEIKAKSEMKSGTNGPSPKANAIRPGISTSPKGLAPKGSPGRSEVMTGASGMTPKASSIRSDTTSINEPTPKGSPMGPAQTTSENGLTKKAESGRNVDQVTPTGSAIKPAMRTNLKSAMQKQSSIRSEPGTGASGLTPKGNDIKAATSPSMKKVRLKTNAISVPNGYIYVRPPELEDYEDESEVERRIATKKQAAAKALLRLQEVMTMPSWEERPGRDQLRTTSKLPGHWRDLSIEDGSPIAPSSIFNRVRMPSSAQSLPTHSAMKKQDDRTAVMNNGTRARDHRLELPSGGSRADRHPVSRRSTNKRQHRDKGQSSPTGRADIAPLWWQLDGKGRSGDGDAIATTTATAGAGAATNGVVASSSSAAPTPRLWQGHSRMGSTMSASSGASAHSLPRHMVPARGSSRRDSDAYTGDLNDDDSSW